jgi:hypothetical protein
MSAGFPSAAVGDYSTPTSAPRSPLGLPRGSVRALLTFMVLGTFWALLLMPKERDIHIPLYLLYLTFLVIGSYFGNRAAAHQSGESPPLGLPRGSIRFLIIVGFLAVCGWGWYNDRDFFSNIRFDQAAEQPFLPFIIFGAFFLGTVVTTMAHAVLAGPAGLPYWYQDLQAWVSLIAVLGLGAEVIYQLVIKPGLDPATAMELPQWQTILSAIVAFYFGARSR